MRTSSRWLCGLVLTAALGWAAGCGGAKDDASGSPKADPPPETPPPGASAWEMDPAKHAIPAVPVGGQLAGSPFAPEVQIQGGALRFRILKEDGLVERQIELRFVEPGKRFEGRKLTVRPDQPAGPDVPLMLITRPDPQSKTPEFLDKGYALTLEVGQRQGGKVPGKVYLSLPGHDFLAGTFSAEYLRTEDEPPGPDDAPFIHGKLTVNGATEPNVIVGYVRVDPFNPDTPFAGLIGTILKPGGFPIRDEANRPRVTVLIPGAKANDPARFEFVRLEPGRYWVLAAVQGGPVVSQWVTVAPGSQLTADLTLDVAAFGSLEVSVSGPAQKVWVLPAAEPGKPWPEPAIPFAASMVGLQADAPDPAKKDARAKFPRLSPGKYEVRAGGMSGTVEVKRGETAKLELMPPKK